MNVARKVNRAFAMDGIPSSRIGTAEKLNFQAKACGGIGRIFTNHFLGRFPCGATWCAPRDSYALNLTVDNINIHLWCTKTFLIASQAARPGKAASGGRGDNTGSGMLFAGCNHRDFLVCTQPGQIVREVRMF